MPQLLEQEVWPVYETSLIADKLRAIYVLFGWAHMLKSLDDAQDVVESLTTHVFEALLDKEDAEVSSAGLAVRGWYDDEGTINMEYWFNLV